MFYLFISSKRYKNSYNESESFFITSYSDNFLLQKFSTNDKDVKIYIWSDFLCNFFYEYEHGSHSRYIYVNVYKDTT